MAYLELSAGPLEYHWAPGPSAAAPLVFLHEGLGSIVSWGRLPAALGRLTGRSCLTFSRHGYGDSGPVPLPRPTCYMADEAAGALPELLRRLDIEEPVLVGHSDGASIAIHYAADNPVAGAVLMTPHVFVEDKAIAGIKATRASFLEGPLKRKLAGVHDDPEAVFGGWTGVWLSAAFRDWNIEDRLPLIDCPVLLIQGDKDQYGTFAQLDRIENGVTGKVTRAEFADCDHWPFVQQPQLTTDAIVAFLEGCA